MSEQEPVFTQSYYTREHRGIIPLDRSLNPGDPGYLSPESLVGYSTAGVAPNEYPRLTDASPSQFFPASHLSSDSWADFLNDSTSVPNNASPPDLYGPLMPTELSGVPYESIAIDTLYNVKTWRLVGSVLGHSFDLTIPAGQVLDIGGIYTPASRPNSGKRGIYSTSAEWEYIFSDDDESINVSLDFYIGGERLVGDSANLYTFVPHLQFQIASSADEISDVQSARFTAGSVDANITFLGQPVYSESVGTTTTSYSLTITAEERWDETDEWVSQA